MNPRELPTPQEAEGDVGRGNSATLKADLMKIAAETRTTGVDAAPAQAGESAPSVEQQRETRVTASGQEAMEDTSEPIESQETQGLSPEVVRARQELIAFATQSQQQARNLESIIRDVLPEVVSLLQSNPDLAAVAQTLHGAQGDAEMLLQGLARNSGEYETLADMATIKSIRGVLDRNMTEIAQKAILAVSQLSNLREGRQLRVSPDRAQALDQKLDMAITQVRSWHGRMYQAR
ncbi:hypothetical protein IT415_03730 [bacterium]|nr:hypothetical protein [bacterium]